MAVETIPVAPGESVEQEYKPFPGDGGRNWRQAHLEIPLMVLLLDLPECARVLEIGCGTGVALPALARRLRPSRLVGVDISWSLLQEARARAERHHIDPELYQGDARDLPFPDASFDMVIDFGTCYHIARQQDALRHIARVLVPGGLFVAETKLSQVLSHPFRSRGRRLGWPPEFVRRSRAFLWESRVVTEFSRAMPRAARPWKHDARADSSPQTRPTRAPRQ